MAQERVKGIMEVIMETFLKKLLPTLFMLGIFASSINAMEPESMQIKAIDSQTNIDSLPLDVIKLIFITKINGAKTIEDALDGINAAAMANKAFLRILKGQELTKTIINALITKFPEETKKDPVLAAIFLHTPGALEWLQKSHPEWKDQAKNLGIHLFEELTAAGWTFKFKSQAFRALLNVPEILRFFATKYRCKNGYTALMLAAEDDPINIVEILLANGADPNIQNRYGRTALLMASEKGRKKIVKILLARGAGPNFQNIYGNTALMEASRRGNTEIVKILLKTKEADPDIQNIHGKTAAMIARANGHDNIAQLIEKWKDSPAFWDYAYENGHKAVMWELFKAGGAPKWLYAATAAGALGIGYAAYEWLFKKE